MLFVFSFLSTRRQPDLTRTDTLVPYTSLFRSVVGVHDDLLSLFLVSARASRRISTPPLMAMMAVAKPTRRSGQLVPSHSTSTPAIRMPPLEMKSLKLKV